MNVDPDLNQNAAMKCSRIWSDGLVPLRRCETVAIAKAGIARKSMQRQTGPAMKI
jgi:hypothetical protein